MSEAPTHSNRRVMRRIALQALCVLDQCGTLENLSNTSDDAWWDDECETAEKIRETDYQEAIIWAEQAFQHKERCDNLIERIAPQWPARRQPLVDRALIRLAVYEIEHVGTPVEIAINEAVELSKAFASDKSAGFINATLQRLTTDGRLIPAPASQAPQKNKTKTESWLDNANQELNDELSS